MIVANLADLQGVVAGHAEVPLQAGLADRIGRVNQDLAAVHRQFDPGGRVPFSPQPNANGHRPRGDAKAKLRTSGLVVHEIVGPLRGLAEPDFHGLFLVLPRAPGDVVCAAEVGVQQHFLGRLANRRMLAGSQGAGQLRGLGVITIRSAIVGRVARGGDVAQQASGPGLDLRQIGGQFDRLFRLVHGLLQPARLGQRLRLRHAAMRVARREPRRLRPRRRRLLILAQGDQRAAPQHVAPGAVRLEQQGLVEVAKAELGMGVEIRFRAQEERLGADRFEDDVRDVHRRLARRVGRREGEQDAPLRIALAEDLAQFVGHQHRLNLRQIESAGPPWRREPACRNE